MSIAIDNSNLSDTRVDGWNLADVVTLVKAMPPIAGPLIDHLAEALRIGTLRRDLGNLQPFAESKDEVATLERLGMKMATQMDGLRASILNATMTLPEELRVSPSGGQTFALLAATPVVEIAEIRRLADLLGFVVFPYEYLAPEALDSADSETQKAISAFVQRGPKVSASTATRTWVLAPLPFYDLDRHITAAVDWPIYAGQSIAQVFMTLGMVVPMFRSLRADIKQLQDVETRVGREVQSVKLRLEQLHDNFEREQARRLVAEAREVEARLEAERRHAEETRASARRHAEELAESESRRRADLVRLEQVVQRRRWLRHDPMLVQLQEGRSITDEGLAWVGPCWGPDFETVVLSSFGLNQVAGQRAAIEASTARWSALA
jgi:hypothetical protein